MKTLQSALSNAFLLAASISSLSAMLLASFVQTAQSDPLAAAPAKIQAPNPEMARVLKKLTELGAKPLSTLSVAQARVQPTPADAVAALLKDEGKDATAMKADMKISIADMSYDGAAGKQPVRIYTPEGAAPPGGFPVIVYFHGGGFVIATINTYESSAMALARKTNAIVASVEYRHAPENKFPAAHEDAIAAYKWIISNTAKWHGNPQRLALVGESAGGNLALNVAIMARDQKLQVPLHMVLVYPVAGTNTDTPSYLANADASPLGKADMEWFFDKVLAKPEDKNSPMLDLVNKADLKGLPGATVITDQIDPLMSEGKTLADRLKTAGDTVNYKNFDGVTHEFFGMNAVVAEAEQAQQVAADDLKTAFASLKSSAQTADEAIAGSASTSIQTVALAAQSPSIVTLNRSDMLSTNIVGLDIYDGAKDDIGKVSDIAFDSSKAVKAYILSVGGFLGMGVHYVAVDPASVVVTYDSGDKKWHGTMDATKEQLKAMPEFKYQDQWSARKT